MNNEYLTSKSLENLSKSDLIKMIIQEPKIKKQKTSIDTSKKAIKIIKKIKIDYERENFIIIMLDNGLTVIDKKVMFSGHESAIADIPAKTIIREMIKGKKMSGKLIVAHNHPSGSINASDADIQFTKQLKKCMDMLDLQLIDHIIFTKKSYMSMKEHNYC